MLCTVLWLEAQRVIWDSLVLTQGHSVWLYPLLTVANTHTHTHKETCFSFPLVYSLCKSLWIRKCISVCLQWQGCCRWARRIWVLLSPLMFNISKVWTAIQHQTSPNISRRFDARQLFTICVICFILYESQIFDIGRYWYYTVEMQSLLPEVFAVIQQCSIWGLI